MKRVFGTFEVVFDGAYLLSAGIIGVILILTVRGGEGDTPARLTAGIMALTLAGGDSFHLIPRMQLILTQEEERLRPLLGRGKQITSITMTIFYLLLYHIALMIYGLPVMSIWTAVLYGLAGIRMILCLMPQNRWLEEHPPVSWGVIRNLPFLAMGLLVASVYLVNRGLFPGVEWMWLSILLSFGCYMPVVLWADRYPMIGMLMLPKTCAYLWMMLMCLSL